MTDTLVQIDSVRRRFTVTGVVQGVGFRPFVHRIATDGRVELGQHLVLAEIALDERDALDGLHLEDVQRDNAAVEFAHRRAAGLGRELAADVLAPGARRRAEIHHQLTRTQQLELLVDLRQLVGRASAITLALRQFHIGVVGVILQPLLVDLLAFRLDFHDYGIIRAWP